MPLLSLLDRWPLWRQLTRGGDGTGPEAYSARTEALQPRTDGAKVARSVCPYCAVGCGQRILHKKGRVVAVEGDPESPINAGKLCPKGAATFELLTHSHRLEKVLYRAPKAAQWREMPLEEAMDRVVERLWESRKRTFEEKDEQGRRLGRTTAVAHLGGATLDNEENYLIRKLFTGGLGLVAVSNQART
ncbi:MAG: hypothetical protein AAGD01_00550 [Acidobacteriota bacterium]